MKDALTKWVEMFPLRDKLAVTIVDALVDQVFLRFGAPRTFITDRGTEFDNHLLKEVCDLLGARHIRCTPQNPRSDGLAENQMRTFKDALSQLVNKHHDDWDEFIPMLAMHYRTAVIDATAYTSYYMMFGRKAIAPDFGRVPTPSTSKQHVSEYIRTRRDLLLDLWSQVSDRVVSNVDRFNRVPRQRLQLVPYEPGQWCFLRRVPRRFYYSKTDEINYLLSSK